MLDQLQIGNMYSYDDFEASVAKRKISNPKKKSIKETVPFSNITYDFSAINGEVYWEERSLEYVFEITADSPEELEELKTYFSSWVMNVMNEKLYDPFIEGYHFLATYDDMSCDDEESMEKTTVTVKFSAYPYMIANHPKKYTASVTKGAEITLKVTNNSSHRITPKLIADVPVQITIGNLVYTMGASTLEDEVVKLAIGLNEVKVKAANTSGTFTIEFVEEVF